MASPQRREKDAVAAAVGSEGDGSSRAIPRREHRGDDRDGRHQKRAALYRSDRDNDPSPKRGKREEKLETEKHQSNSRVLDGAKAPERDQRRRRRSPDILERVNRREVEASKSNDELRGDSGKADRFAAGSEHFPNSREAPQPRTYFQHDERESAGERGRRFERQGHGRHDEHAPHEGDRTVDRRAKEQKFPEKGEHPLPPPPPARNESDPAWRHDLYPLVADAPAAKRRPAFRETKMTMQPEAVASRTESDPRLPRSDEPVVAVARRDERGQPRSGFQRSDRPPRREDERNDDRDVSFRRNAGRWGDNQPRGRFNGGGSSRGSSGREWQNGARERNVTRPVAVEKWKHDLFDDANKSPPPAKSEEEQIAKVEALLAL